LTNNYFESNKGKVEIESRAAEREGKGIIVSSEDLEDEKQ